MQYLIELNSLYIYIILIYGIKQVNYFELNLSLTFFSLPL